MITSLRPHSLRRAMTALAGGLLLAFVAWHIPAHAREETFGATLDELIEYARANNPELLASRLDAAAVRERIIPSVALPDPRFEVELMDFTNAMNPGRPASLIPGEVGATRYRVVQMLPFPGKRGLRGEIAASRADQADTVSTAARLGVEGAVRTAYARYFQAVGQAQILRETLTLVESLEQLVLTRYGLGLVPQQDAVRVQSELTTLKVDLVESERRRADATVRLNALLPRPANAPLADPRGLPPLPSRLDLAALVQQAAINSPDLERERLGVTAAERSRELVQLDRYPDFGVALSNNRPRGGRDSWDLMLEFNIPLQQASRRAREREAERVIEASRARAEATSARLHGRLGAAHAAVEANREKTRLLRDTLLPQARANLEAAQAGYETGSVNFNTLIEAERQILRTRLALLDAEVGAILGLAELEQLVGVSL